MCRPPTGATFNTRIGTSAGRSNRRFADGTYFETELSQRCIAIENEINNIKNKSESIDFL